MKHALVLFGRKAEYAALQATRLDQWVTNIKAPFSAIRKFEDLNYKLNAKLYAVGFDEELKSCKHAYDAYYTIRRYGNMVEYPESFFEREYEASNTPEKFDFGRRVDFDERAYNDQRAYFDALSGVQRDLKPKSDFDRWYDERQAYFDAVSGGTGYYNKPKNR